MAYVRYFNTIKKDKDNINKRVESIDIKVHGDNFTGTMNVTDLMIQEGEFVTGYITANKEMLLKYRDDENNITPPKHYNATIRNNKTIIIPNEGEVTTGLNIELECLYDTSANTITLEHGYSTRIHKINVDLKSGDTYKINSDNRKVTKNNQEIVNNKFLQCPANDAMFQINIPNKKGSKFLFEVQSRQYGIGGKKL